MITTDFLLISTVFSQSNITFEARYVIFCLGCLSHFEILRVLVVMISFQISDFKNPSGFDGLILEGKAFEYADGIN